MTDLLLALTFAAILAGWATFSQIPVVGFAAAASLLAGFALSENSAVFGITAAVIALGLGVLILAKPNERISPRFAVLLALIMFAVGFLSGGEGAPGDSPSWFEMIGLSKEAAEIIVLVVRKVIHFCGYGFLGFVAFRTPSPASIRFGLVWALSTAVFDEMRQSLNPNRSGSPVDVMLDMAGAATFVYLARHLAERRATAAPKIDR